MKTNLLFLRDLIGITVTIAAVTTAVLTLAPRAPPAAHAPDASSQARRGASLFEEKGCVVCHSVDGTARIGPSLLQAYGSQVTLGDGSVVAMDDAYIRESLLQPLAKARPGYPPSMPSFDGFLEERDLDAIVVYVRTLE